jgi:hypothetical protein
MEPKSSPDLPPKIGGGEDSLLLEGGEDGHHLLWSPVYDLYEQPAPPLTALYKQSLLPHKLLITCELLRFQISIVQGIQWFLLSSYMMILSF